MKESHCDMKGDAFLWTSCIANFQWVLNTMISWNSNSPDWAQPCTTHQPCKSQSIAILFWTRRISEWQQAVTFLAILSTGTKSGQRMPKRGFICSSKINLKTSNSKKLPSTQPPAQRGLGRCISKGINSEKCSNLESFATGQASLTWGYTKHDVRKNSPGKEKEIFLHLSGMYKCPAINEVDTVYSATQKFVILFLEDVPLPHYYLASKPQIRYSSMPW